MTNENTLKLQSLNNDSEESKKKKSSAYRGLLLAIVAGVVNSVSLAFVKQMKNLHPIQLATYRLLAMTIFSFPAALKSGENLLGPKNCRFMLIIQTTFQATCNILGFIAVRYLPLGESAVIIFSFPVFTTIAAKMFLKEPCGIFQFVTVLMTVIGILFTIKVPQKLAGSLVEYTTESIYGFASAITTLFFSTVVIIVVRKIKRVDSNIVVFSFGWVAVLETAIMTAIFGSFKMQQCGLQSLYIIMIGVLGYISHVLMIKALQCEMAGPVSTIKAASEIVVAFLWQSVLFHDIPDLYSAIGAALVGVSVIFVCLTKWVSSVGEESLYRKKLNWLLK